MDTVDANFPKASDFSNGQPYTAMAGEVVADMLALLRLVQERRPETRDFPGAVVMSVHALTGEILLGLEQKDGRAIIIEQIAADPGRPDAFGSSVLAIALPADARPH